VEQVPTILVNEEKSKDPTNVAKAFNNFFITITEKVNNQQTGKGNSTSVLKVSFPGNFSSLKIIPFTEADIKSIMHFLKKIQVMMK